MDETLYEKDLFLVPDALVNAGRVICSHIEWVQNPAREHGILVEVNKRLEGTIAKAFDDDYMTMEKEETTMRTAALPLGGGRAAEATETLGLGARFSLFSSPFACAGNQRPSISSVGGK